MLLSVIVPVYNVQDCLQRCVQSLLTDRCKLDYEIILVDDGSTDESGKICDELQLNYDCIKVFHKPNGGLSDARNYGLINALGEYVVFIDSDDYVEADAIAKICEQLRQEKHDIYCCDYYSLHGGKRTDIRYTPTDDVKSGVEFMKYQLAHCSMISSVVQNIYKRSLLLNNNLFFKKGIYHEDEEWYPRVFLCANSVKYLNFVYYAYIIRENSIMQQRDFSKHIADFISTMSELIKIFSAHVDSELFCLLKDSIVDKYLSIYARGQFDGKNKEIILPGKYLKTGLVHKKTKIKVFIFCLSKKLFCKMSRIYASRRQ